MKSWLIQALWLAWVAYWIAAAIGAKPSSRRESWASRLGHTLPLLAAMVLLTVPSMHNWLGQRILPSWLWWPGAVLTAAGLAFACWARLHLGRNWSAEVTVKQNHELIRSGPYGLVRHPIYTGILLAISGTAIAQGEWRSLLAVLLVLIAFQRKMRLEEQWMTEQFPGQYAQYRSTVPALVPRLF